MLSNIHLPNSKKFWGIVLVVLVLAGAGFWYWRKKHAAGKEPEESGASGSKKVSLLPMTKNEAVNLIISSKSSSGTSTTLNKLGSDYLVTWAKAIKAGDPEFVVNGSYYNVKGGKKVQ